jgi:5-methylcytosine-specific restriction endonuclease McrA
MAPRKKQQKAVDGLSAKDIAKIRSAVRQVWHRSHVRKLCVKRATGADGFFRCEKCKKKTPKLCIDHITPVGELDGGFIKRLFCPSKDLQALCVSCHNKKTKQEREAKAIERLIGL